MPQRLFIALFFLANLYHASAQTIPVENDTLNYRLVGFSVLPDTKADGYLFEIAQGRINNNIDFQKNIIITTISIDNQIIATVPEFGKEYTWRVNYRNKKGKIKSKSELYHFTTGISKYTDTAKFRVRILKNTNAYDGLLVFYDNTRTLRDMNGNVVWYLPDIPALVNENATIRDLKLTPQGTISFLMGSSAIEVNYHGKVLWKAPNDGSVSNDTSEYYHHEFTRLPNGNYMVAGIQYVPREIPGIVDSSAYLNQWNVKRIDNKFYNNIPFGTLIEYDPQGKVVWSWNSARFFTDEDLFTRRIHGKIMTSTHPNAFYFDEKKQAIYTSYRDANKIIKIAYPSGTMLAKYGKILNPDKAGTEPYLFSAQHNCRVNADGNLYLFNNNTPLRGSGVSPREGVSSVDIFKEMNDPANELVKVWEFACNVDTFALPCSTGGGSVYELADKNILVSMGVVNRDFIVTPDKKILWNVLTEMKQNDDKTWIPHDNYRVSPIEHPDDVKRLIFH